DRDRVRRHIDEAAPALGDADSREGREAAYEVLAAGGENRLMRLGIERAHHFARRRLVEPPAARDAPSFDEAPANAQPELAPAGAQRRHEVEEEAEAVRHDRRNIGIALGDGVAAVEPLAEGEVAGADRLLRWAVD